MNPSEQTLLSESLYSEMLDKIASNNRSVFSGINLGNDVENSLLLSWISQPVETVSVEQFIDNQYPRIIESYFSELRNQCFQFCLSRTQQFETAEDIAQEVMMQLLTSKQVISNIRPWLMKVTHNLICKHYQNNTDDRQMHQQLEIENHVLSEILSASSLKDISLKTFRQIPELCNSPACSAVMELFQYKTLHNYAEAKGISKQQAKQTSKELKRDFKALCLKHFGWEDSPDILSYNQVKSIQRYLRQLIHHITQDNSQSLRKNSILLDQAAMYETLEGFSTIDDWGINSIGENKFSIHIFRLDDNGDPLCASITICIKDNNRIITETCKLNPSVAILTIPENIIIPKDKGRSTLTFEQIKSLLSS
jgi:hypothetical protein